jgi:hypothetical protein
MDALAFVLPQGADDRPRAYDGDARPRDLGRTPVQDGGDPREPDASRRAGMRQARRRPRTADQHNYPPTGSTRRRHLSIPFPCSGGARRSLSTSPSPAPLAHGSRARGGRDRRRSRDVVKPCAPLGASVGSALALAEIREWGQGELRTADVVEASSLWRRWCRGGADLDPVWRPWLRRPSHALVTPSSSLLPRAARRRTEGARSRSQRGEPGAPAVEQSSRQAAPRRPWRRRPLT